MWDKNCDDRHTILSRLTATADRWHKNWFVNDLVANLVLAGVIVLIVKVSKAIRYVG